MQPYPSNEHPISIDNRWKWFGACNCVRNGTIYSRIKVLVPYGTKKSKSKRV